MLNIILDWHTTVRELQTHSPIIIHGYLFQCSLQHNILSIFIPSKYIYPVALVVAVAGKLIGIRMPIAAY